MASRMQVAAGPFAACLVAAGMVVMAAPACAQVFFVEYDIEIQDDYVSESDISDEEVNTLFTETEVFVETRFTRGFSLMTGLVFEPVQPYDVGEENFFDNHGLYVEELYFNIEYAPVTARLGKINPRFGIAWDRTPGIYGVDIAEDYEITEQWGLELIYAFEAIAGARHELSAAIFTADTTALSDSIFTRRGELDEDDGGVTNSGDLGSFSITLQGDGFSTLPGLAYHVGFERLARGVGNTDDQTGIVAGLTWSNRFEGDWIFGTLIEVADFGGFAGTEQDEAFYLTAAAELGYDFWALTVAHTTRSLEITNNVQDDRQTQVSAAFALDEGVVLDAGWRLLQVNGVDSHTLGVRLNWFGGFSAL